MRIAQNILSRILTPLLILANPAIGPALAAPVTLADQQVVIEHFRSTFVLPQFTQWRFDKAGPYRLGGTLICGGVNFQNSVRRYVGEQPFYAVVRDGKFTEGGIVGNAVQDPAGTVQFAYNILCQDH